MATHRVRCYFDGYIPSNQTAEEIDAELKRLEELSENLEGWIDPDLED